MNKEVSDEAVEAVTVMDDKHEIVVIVIQNELL